MDIITLLRWGLIIVISLGIVAWASQGMGGEGKK